MIPAGVKVFLASHPVDFRKGPDGLLALVREAGSDPFNGALYVFRAKRADRVKIVWWDGTGVVLYSKRLEKAHFVWPRIGQHRVQLNHAGIEHGHGPEPHAQAARKAGVCIRPARNQGHYRRAAR